MTPVVIPIPAPATNFPVFDFIVNGMYGWNTTAIYPTVAINSGQSVNLVWSSVTNANSCTGSGTSWGGTKAFGGGNDTLNNVTTSSDYILACTGPGGTVTKKVRVHVYAITPAPSFGFTVNNNTDGTTSNYPTTTINFGQSVNLVWNGVGNADTCIGTGTNWAGNKAIGGGSDTLNNVTASSTYTLACTGAGSTVIKGVRVNVNASTPAPIMNFTVNGTSLSSVTVLTGQSATLHWSVAGSGSISSCNASGGWSGSKPFIPEGDRTESVGPFTTNGLRTYTLSCTGPGGTLTKNVQVNVTCSPGACVPNAGQIPANICTGSVAQGTNNCGNSCTIPGTKSCNSDWTETAP
jgi:hypothetical protein